VTLLAFEVVDAAPEPFAAVPTLNFRVRIRELTGASIQAIALRCQVRIEPRRRHYDGDEEARLVELFGESHRWGETLQSLLWANTSLQVAGFRDAVEVDLPMPCTYDFEVAGTKYLDALRDGQIPVQLLFSGTVFLRGPAGMAVEPVPWHHEAGYRLPVAVWREVMDRYFPDSTWIRMRRDTFDRLYQFRTRRARPTWEATFDDLLELAAEPQAVDPR
jgi:uncharacterized protein DUF6084